MVRQVILFFFATVIFAKPVFAADVVLNEFQVKPSTTQWVELFNTGSSSKDISGWIIDDDGSPSQKYIIPPNTDLPSGKCIVFSSGNFNFNPSSPDSIQLLLPDNTLVDQYAYPESSASSVWFGRLPDGTGTWEIVTISSSGHLNSTGDPCLPPATPTPTPVPTDPPPKPTNTPTPTLTPTRTPIPTKTPTPTLKPTPQPKADQPLAGTTVSAVLGATDSPIAASISADIKTKPSVKPFIISLLLVGIGCAILSLVFVWKKRNLFNTPKSQ